MVCRPSMPGGMRTSTKAVAKRRPSRSERSARSTASWPWAAVVSSNTGWAGAACASPKKARRALVSPWEAAGAARILRKSSRIDSWSSTTRMRRFLLSGMGLGRRQGGLLHGSVLQRDVQEERGAATGTLARRVELRAHLRGRVGRDVQAEAVAVLLGREAVVEDARQVLARDADAVVAHLDARRALVGPREAQRQAPLARGALGQGLAGVLDQVDQD